MNSGAVRFPTPPSFIFHSASFSSSVIAGHKPAHHIGLSLLVFFKTLILSPIMSLCFEHTHAVWLCGNHSDTSEMFKGGKRRLPSKRSLGTLTLTSPAWRAHTCLRLRDGSCTARASPPVAFHVAIECGHLAV